MGTAFFTPTLNASTLLEGQTVDHNNLFKVVSGPNCHKMSQMARNILKRILLDTSNDASDLLFYMPSSMHRLHGETHLIDSEHYRFLLVSVSPSSSISSSSSPDPSTSLPSECRRRRSFFNTWRTPSDNDKPHSTYLRNMQDLMKCVLKKIFDDFVVYTNK